MTRFLIFALSLTLLLAACDSAPYKIDKQEVAGSILADCAPTRYCPPAPLDSVWWESECKEVTVYWQVADTANVTGGYLLLYDEKMDFPPCEGCCYGSKGSISGLTPVHVGDVYLFTVTFDYEAYWGDVGYRAFMPAVNYTSSSCQYSCVEFFPDICGGSGGGKFDPQG